MNKINKKAISPIVATILLVVVAAILITIILSWGKDFSNKALATTDTEKISQSDSENFVYTKSFSDGVVQFNYDPVGNLNGQEITIIGYKIIAGGQESEYVAFDPALSLSAGLNVFELLDFSDLNIAERKMDVIFYTSDGKYITLRNITNPSPYVAPVIEPCSLIPENGEIYYLEHLDYIDTNATTLAGSYTLIRDLNFLDDASYCEPETYKTTWTTGTGWDPIGYNNIEFKGSFDGQNYKISNLYINDPGVDPFWKGYDLGLFGYIETPASISNLGLEDLNITGVAYIGGLVAEKNSGTITNCYTTGNIYSIPAGYSNIGGLVGGNWEGDINNSYSEVNIYDTGTHEYTGGLVGQNSCGNIFGSYATGFVLGYSYVGGLVGYSCGLISQSFATGDVNGSSPNGNATVGGLVGQNETTITDSYSLGDVARVSGGTSTYFGGSIGYNSGTISNSYSTGRVIYAGTTNPTNRGFSYSSVSSSDYWDMNTSLQTTSGGGAIGETTAQMKTQSTFSGWDFSTVWNIAGATYPYLRNNTEHLIPSITSPINGYECTGFCNGYNFVGTAINPQGDYTCSWNSSLDGSLGSGCSINAPAMTTGTHIITLSVTDEEQTKTTSISVIVIGGYGGQ